VINSARRFSGKTGQINITALFNFVKPYHRLQNKKAVLSGTAF
jgi:hypothetical protein